MQDRQRKSIRIAEIKIAEMLFKNIKFSSIVHESQSNLSQSDTQMIKGRKEQAQIIPNVAVGRIPS